MNKEIVLLDLFSGIGGFALGLKNANFNIKTHYFSEIEKHAIANYQLNFKNSKYVGAINDILREPKLKPTIITFGSPCQDFSLAGKRQGLAGARSNLIKQAIKIVAKEKPKFFIWENVKGAFSSNNGADFWAIIQAFANIGNYRLEWQLLNTSWVLPQNRERIYLVGHLASSKRNFKPIFPITENDRLLISKKQNQPQTKHYSTTIGKKIDRKDSTFINTLNLGKHQQDRVYKENGIMCCLPSQRTEDKIKIEVNPKNAQAIITPERKNKRQNGRKIKNIGEPSFTLNKQDQHGVLINKKLRKLTEIECERLQGFPDNWTKYGLYNDKKKLIKKTNRYQLIGNAVTVNIVQLIANKIEL